MAGYDPRPFYESGLPYESTAPYDGFYYPGPNNSDWKIELAVDLAANGVGDWFTLDDPIKGLLDNATYLLAGEVLVDLTRWVRNLGVRRGRSRRLDKFTAGQAQVVFDNRDRIFDPDLTGSPFFGSIVPRKQLVITYLNERIFTGNVEDWDFSFDPSREITATARCADAFAALSRRTYFAATETAQTTLQRVAVVLDALDWPAASRAIVSGGADGTVGADVHDDVSALAYLQSIEASELGALFIDRNGKVAFYGKPYNAESSKATFGDNGIPFSEIDIVYEADQMVNDATVEYLGGSVNVIDTTSQDAYGPMAQSYTTILSASAGANVYAQSIIASYKDPQYYINRIRVDLRGVNTSQRGVLLALDIHDLVTIVWQPGDIGPVDTRILRIDGIEHSVTPSTHTVTFTMSTDLTIV